ncbi:radical SAM family heme chaperone HemW [Lysobacter chinensis]|uniref:Heme chaperone HemW n=1 Tax=Marilutibacter chinensis TaxID=2912247 RepID=A0ABS9I0M9_9GAMM|nr:radical SAM family heme chaperone HemW [Lysobacter chinensis]MCF7223837.1 radical SAM family heme chaperone HemW [Lysobacter chinensis]
MPHLSPPPLSLYVHLPWCVRKCPYCDFNSHEGRGPLPFDAYVDALIRDLDHDLPLVWGRTVHSVFFGGGTPSLFPPEAIDRFLQEASARLRFVPGCEVTLETNPGTAEHGRFELYREAGINRLSFGIQSFDDGSLRRLGRIHDSREAEAAVKLAQDAGLDNLNLDLMYALPEQTLAMAERDLERAFALRPAHISHYQLTLEPNTVFAARPPSGIPDEDHSWEMQEHCQALLADAGYAQYEVSAYARDGRRCAHNLNYWHYGDYLGIGAGAHGKITLPAVDDVPSARIFDAHARSAGPAETLAASGDRVDSDAAQDPGGIILRRWKQKHPARYIADAGTDAAIGGDDPVTPERRAFEYMLNALRLVDGFRLGEFIARTGLAADDIRPQLETAVERGWLEQDGNRLRPTELGRRFTNDVIALFL